MWCKLHPELLLEHYIDQLTKATLRHMHVDGFGGIAVDEPSKL